MMHNFKLVPKRRLKTKFLSGYTPSTKVKYHCKNCDSTVEYEQRVDIYELNKYMSDPINNFPCINPKKDRL